jgi:hypothetical protein
MNPLGLNKNKSTVFILPMVFATKKHSNILTDNFKNAYIADFDKPEYDDKLTVVWDYHTFGNTIDRFDIPDEYLGDYVKIIAGAYTATSDKYKQMLLSFWDSNDTTILYKVLYGKDVDNVEEVLPCFDLSQEIYNIGVPL